MFASRENDLVWLIAGIAIFVAATIVQKILTRKYEKEAEEVKKNRKVFLHPAVLLENVSPETAGAIVESLNMYLEDESGKRFMVRSIKSLSRTDTK